MPQLDFSWWLFHLLLNWTLWAAVFCLLASWNTYPSDLSANTN